MSQNPLVKSKKASRRESNETNDILLREAWRHHLSAAKDQLCESSKMGQESSLFWISAEYPGA